NPDVPQAKEESVPEPSPSIAQVERGEPELRPALMLEPTHLQLSEQDFSLAREIEVPYLPKQSAPPDSSAMPEEVPLALRPTPEDLRESFRMNLPVLGLTVRPLPDESDLESWPAPEAGLEGLLLLGKANARVPGLELSLDLPFSRDDSLR